MRKQIETSIISYALIALLLCLCFWLAYLLLPPGDFLAVVVLFLLVNIASDLYASVACEVVEKAFLLDLFDLLCQSLLD